MTGISLWIFLPVMIFLGINDIGNWSELLRSPLPVFLPVGGSLCIWYFIRQRKKANQGALSIAVYEKGILVRQAGEESYFMFEEIKGINYWNRAESDIVTIYINDEKKIVLDKHTVRDLPELSGQLRDAHNQILNTMAETKEDVKKLNIYFDFNVKMEGGIVKSKKKEVPFEEITAIKYLGDGTGGSEWHLFGANDKTLFRLNEVRVMNLDLLGHIIYNLGSGKVREQIDLSFLSSEHTKSFEREHALSKEDERDLAFCSVLMIMNHDSPKVLKIEDDRVYKKRLKKMLRDGWGINDQSEAVEALEALTTATTHTPFTKAFLHSGASERAASIEQENFEDMLRLLGKLGYTEDELENIQTFAAWDYGRVGFIARNALHMGYIEEETAWTYIRIAASEARDYYGSWREFLAAYILGRAIAYDVSWDFEDIYKYLLFDENSPFVIHDF